MKVALYTRCSSDMQEGIDRSIPAQIKALREYCDRKGYLIQKEYNDPAESAYGDDENREKFHEMIKDAKEHKFEAIIVHKFNRFYRDQFKSMFYKKMLKEHGVRVISMSEELDPETTQGFLMERIIETFDQMYSMNIAWEVMKGMRENARQGYKNGGVVPYGYKRVQIPIDVNRPNPKYKIKWEIDEGKAPIVKKIFELRYEGKSLRKICNYLNENMIPSPRGGFWGISTVRNILIHADIYAGDYWWNVYDKKNKGKKYNDKKDWVIVKDIHPAIVDRKIAEKAKVMIGSSNNNKFVPQKFSRYILTGKNYYGDPLFICKRCGSNYVGYQFKNKRDGEYYKYICSKYWNYGKIACGDSFYIDKDIIEQEVINEICKRYDNIKNINELVKEILDGEKQKSVEIKVNLKIVDAELRKINSEIDQIAKAIKKGVDGSILAPKSKELAIRLDNCKSKRKEIIEEEKIKNEINVTKITDYISNFKNIIKNGTYEQKHIAIISFLKQIIADPEEKKIYLKFYEIPAELLTSSSVGARNRN